MDMKHPQLPAIRHFRGQLTTCPNTNSQVPASHEYKEAIVAMVDCATKVLDNFPRERSKLLSLLSCELGWHSWSNDDEELDEIGNVRTRTPTELFFWEV